MTGSYPSVPDAPAFSAAGLRQIAVVLKRMLVGGLNVTGDLTLTASANSTTLSDPRINVNSVILLMPKTANAQAELSNVAQPLYFDTPASGSVVIHHNNNAQNDRTYRVIILG